MGEPETLQIQRESLTKFVTDDYTFHLYLEMAPNTGKGLSGRNSEKESMAMEGKVRARR